MGTPVTVPMVGKIVSVSVKVGDKVQEDDQIAVLEAMKMEMPVVAPVTGTVKEIHISPGQEVEADPKVKVVAFNSADPDYFVARGDIVAILGLPDQVPPKSNTIGFVHAIMDRFRTMPKVSIAKLEGRARGGGSEFALALDMRFETGP